MLATLTSQKVNDRESRETCMGIRQYGLKCLYLVRGRVQWLKLHCLFSLFDFVFLSARNVSYLTTVCFAINLLLSVLKEQFKQTTKMNEKNIVVLQVF